MEITVKVLNKKGLDQIEKNLKGRAARRVLQAIGEKLHEIILSNFGLEGEYRPEPWPPYAHDYPKYGKYEGDEVDLIRSQALMRSITVDITDNYVDVGTDVDYADYHQYGTSNMPARPFIPIRGEKVIPEVQEELEKIAYEVFTEELNAD